VKRLIAILFLFCALATNGQKFGHWAKNYLKTNAPSLLCSFGAGLWSGQMDALQFHYCSVKKEFPSIDDRWFDPSKSWTNKYYHHDPNQGEAFPLSTTVFVGFTDEWHWAQLQRDALLACAITFHLGVKQKWFYYILDIAVYSVTYLIGKNISYELYSLHK
jgi:hypothetical protein